MFHGIVSGGGGWKPFKNEKVFEQVLQNIKKREKNIWVCTFLDFCKYKKLRNAAVIKLHNNTNSLSFTVKTPYKYNTPLTVKITPCPSKSTAVQNGKNLEIAYRNNSGYLNVIPEHGKVKLSIQ